MIWPTRYRKWLAEMWRPVSVNRSRRCRSNRRPQKWYNPHHRADDDPNPAHLWRADDWLRLAEICKRQRIVAIGVADLGAGSFGDRGSYCAGFGGGKYADGEESTLQKWVRKIETKSDCAPVERGG